MPSQAAELKIYFNSNIGHINLKYHIFILDKTNKVVQILSVFSFSSINSIKAEIFYQFLY